MSLRTRTVAGTDHEGVPVRVLICDDDPDVLLLLRMNVEQLGHEAITAQSADEAIAACRQRRPDALLADVTMPGKDGPTLIRELRDAGIEPRSTMLVSAITRRDLMNLAADLGVSWLAKPFTVDVIEQALLELAA